MAAIEKRLVTNLITAYQKKGMSDYEIMQKLLKRKDQVGKNVQTLADRYVDSGSQSPLEDAAAVLGLNVSRPKGSREVGDVNKNPSILDTVKSQAASAAMGFADSAAGINQLNKQFADKANGLVNSVLGTKLDTNAANRYNEQYKLANATTDNLRTQGGRGGGDWVRGGTEIAATLPAFLVGGGPTLSARIANQAVIGSGVGAARYADDNDDRLLNMAGGAVGGAVGQGAGEVVGKGISKVAAKVINARKGNLAPAYKEIDDLGRQFDVNTSVGDINRGAFTGRAEVALEQVPVLGMGGFREAQNTQAVAATNKLAAKLKQAMTDTDYKALPTIKAQANAGNRNAARVLNIVETAGDDTGRVLQASAEVRAFRESNIASKLYDKVDDLVKQSGDDAVSPTNTTAKLTQTLDEQGASLSPDDAIIRELTDIQTNLADAAKPKDFANMRQLRSRLGSLASELGVSGKGAASKAIGDLRQAVDDDIAAFALNSSNQGIRQAYQRADKFYKGAMQRSDKAIANAMKNNKPDEIYNAFVKTGKGDRANNFYQALDQKGQAALRYQMTDEAISKATNESTGNFSPAKFAGEFERMAEPYINIFKSNDKKQMDGLVKLMRHIERAGQYKENPPTGNRVIPWLVAGATAINPVTAIKVGGLSVFAKSMLTTRAGKNLLLAANKLPETQQAALDNILMNAAKVSAANGAKTGQEVSNSVAGTKVSDDNSKALTSF